MVRICTIKDIRPPSSKLISLIYFRNYSLSSYTYRSIKTNCRFFTFTHLCSDDNNSTSRTRSVNSSRTSILQHINLFYIIRINIGQVTRIYNPIQYNQRISSSIN